eukprot:m.289371 g.289371  ORF g.289371 m.289371 type:complete len:64 (-) comp27107_c1_seq5:1106-1297(-)
MHVDIVNRLINIAIILEDVHSASDSQHRGEDGGFTAREACTCRGGRIGGSGGSSRCRTSGPTE